MFAARKLWVTAALAPLALVMAESAAHALDAWDLNPTAHRWLTPSGKIAQDVCLSEAGKPRCFVHMFVDQFAGTQALGADGIAAAYNLTNVTAMSGGAIVASVLWYDNPTIVADLQYYRMQYGLPPITQCTTTLPAPGQSPPCIAVVNQNGASSPLPNGDPMNAIETSLDVEMFSATCPDCNIVVVEANSNQTPDLDAAENTAAGIPGMVAVNNSWGGPEGAGDNTDMAFNHPGVLMVAAAGDSDYLSEGDNQPMPSPLGPGWPASANTVLSVGGTLLKQLQGGARPYTEQVWNDGTLPPGNEYSASGTVSGCSQLYPQPSYQNGLTGPCTMRAENDVSAAASFYNVLGTESGIALYCSYCNGGTGAFRSVFGTSASAPIVTGIFARLGLAKTVANDPGWVYRNAKSFYDVTVGTDDVINPGCGNVLCNAGCGWDGPTGVGTPSGQDLVNAEGDAGTSPNGPCVVVDAGSGSSSGSSSSSGSGSGSGSGGGSSSGSSSGSIGDDSGSGDASLGDDGGGGDDASVDASVEGGMGDGGSNNATGKSSGCGCYSVSSSDSAMNGAVFVLSVAGLILVSRRRKQR